jgi:hypothetical protein
MGVHGVDEDERIRLSNMKALYEHMKSADKILSY